METKPVETEALNQIEALQGRYGFQSAGQNFIKEGADFFTVKYCMILWCIGDA